MEHHEQAGPSDPTRRAFLVTMGSTAAAAVIAGCAPVRPVAQSGSPAAIADGPNLLGAVPLTHRINGKDHQLNIDPPATPPDSIRETVALTGTKKALHHG